MIPQRWIFFAFAAMVILQVGLPLRTVVQHEWTLRYGEVFKFRTQPYDPNDPFRGKYVDLQFAPLEEELPKEKLRALGPDIYDGQELYLLVEKDERGFARAVDLLAQEPKGKVAYVSVRALYPNYENGQLVSIRLRYPFNRFYLEETKAPRADERYREATRQDSTEVYALVNLHNGIAVLSDVMIDGKSLVED